MTSNKSNKKTALVFFIKNAHRTPVKTRLTTELTQLEANIIYSLFLKCYESILNSLSHELEIFIYPQNTIDVVWTKKFWPYQIIKPNNSNNIGSILIFAQRELIELGYDKQIFIGSDSPNINPSLIMHNVALLDYNPNIIGPCLDGGFYCLASKIKLPHKLKTVRWSSSYACTDTLKLLKNSVISPSWYDVDTFQDLQLLKKNLNISNENEKQLLNYINQVDAKINLESVKHPSLNSVYHQY